MSLAALRAVAFLSSISSLVEQHALLAAAVDGSRQRESGSSA
jgi:hypothetical protein